MIYYSKSCTLKGLLSQVESVHTLVHYEWVVQPSKWVPTCIYSSLLWKMSKFSPHCNLGPLLIGKLPSPLQSASNVVMPYIHPCTLTSVHSFFFPLSLGGVGRAANLLSQPTKPTNNLNSFSFLFEKNPTQELGV